MPWAMGELIPVLPLHVIKLEWHRLVLSPQPHQFHGDGVVERHAGNGLQPDRHAAAFALSTAHQYFDRTDHADVGPLLQLQ